MSRNTDRLEETYGEFNANYIKIRRFIKKAIRKDDDQSPESLVALELLDNLDAVLSELVDYLVDEAEEAEAQPTPKP